MSIPAITQTISTPPAPPVAGSGTFDADADACVTYFSTFATEVTAIASQTNATAAGMDAARAATETASTTAGAAAITASSASASAISAAGDATTKAEAAVTAAATATSKASEASNSAASAAAFAASISPGTDPEQLVRAGDLGTAAWLDQAWLYASTTWDAPSCANAAQVSTTVAVPGAEIGDRVMPSASIALSGLNLRGEVTATDVVTLYLSNVTGSPVDLASATYYVAVLKRTPAR